MLADPKKLKQLRREKSLVLIKPDAVQRKLVGELITRFERKGLKIVAMKLTQPTRSQVEAHYTASEDWLKSSGERTYQNFLDRGINKPPMSARELALDTRRRLMEALLAGPVVAMVLEGAHVVELVRKLRGATSPQRADVGTIGFDYSLDSYELSDAGDWPIKNIIHASDSIDNAAREIKIWFKPAELVEYQTAEEIILYSMDWYKKQ